MYLSCLDGVVWGSSIKIEILLTLVVVAFPKAVEPNQHKCCGNANYLICKTALIDNDVRKRDV